jgi:hypothetical protein
MGEPQIPLVCSNRAAGEGSMVISDALDAGATTFLYQPITERKVKP